MAQMSLDSQIKSYWTNRDKNSARGLVLIHDAIKRFAEHGDWDALSRFVTGAMKVGQGPAVKNIIRACFGNHVKWKADSKHDTGGNFTKVNWPGPAFDLSTSNTYGIIRSAVEQGKGWDNKVFQKDLKDALPSVDKKARTVDDASIERAAKHVCTYLKKLEADGFPVGEVLAKVEKERKAAVATVQVKVVNGAKVFEPSF